MVGLQHLHPPAASIHRKLYGGIGPGGCENAPNVRADALANLEELGIKIDPERNSLPNNGAREISTDDSKIKVFVVPTNEELAIARYAMKLAAEA